MNIQEAKEEIIRTVQAILKRTGKASTCFRRPISGLCC